MKISALTRRQVLAGAGATVAGLSSNFVSSSPAKSEAPKRGGKFVYVNLYPNNRAGDDRTGRHPYYLLDLNTRSIYNGLAWVDEQLEVQPELATRWEANADQTIWDIELREGVRFHDGRDMTADDVVASYQFHQANTSFAKQITKVEKTGNFRVRMQLDASNSEFPYIMGEYQLMIMPAAGLDVIGYSGIGTGPFKIASLDAKRRIVAERNDNYWRTGMPYVDTLEIVASPGRMESALNGFRAGLFDAVLGVDPGMVPELQSMRDVQIDTSDAGDQALMILPKHEGSVFNDKRIRQALALAIDREAVERIVYGKRAGWVGNDSHLAPVNSVFLPRNVKRDVAKAKALLAEAGYPQGITLPTFYFAASWPEIPRIFQVIAQTVKEAGITLPIEQRPTNGYREWRVEDREKTRKHKFAYGPSGVRNPGVSLYRMRPDNNESGYWSGGSCDEYMSLYEKATAEQDAGRRRAIYARMQEILHDDVPAILPSGRKNVLISKPNVRDLKNHSQWWSIRFDDVWKHSA